MALKTNIRSDPVFRAEVLRNLKEAIAQRNLSAAAAGRELGVKRQTFSLYLKGKRTPSGPVLATACHKWGLTFRYRGVDFGAGAYRPPERATAEPLQLSLYEAPQILDNGNVILKIGPKTEDKPTLTIEIKFAS